VEQRTYDRAKYFRVPWRYMYFYCSLGCDVILINVWGWFRNRRGRRRPVGSIYGVKLKFHGSSFLIASSWHPRDDVANTSRRNRTCRTRMLATCPQQVVRVVLVDFRERHDTRTNGKHYTEADRRPTNQVSAWQAERGSRPTRVTSS